MMRRIYMVVLLGACHHAAATAPPPPPPAPTCQSVTEHVDKLLASSHHDHPEVAKAIPAIVADHCAKDAWSDDVRSCIVGSPELQSGHHCLDQLPPAQREAFLADMEASTHAALPDDGMPKECHDYKKRMDLFIHCDAIPQVARDAAREAFDTVWDAWSGMPPEGKASLGAACAAAIDGARAMTCPD